MAADGCKLMESNRSSQDKRLPEYHSCQAASQVSPGRSSCHMLLLQTMEPACNRQTFLYLEVSVYSSVLQAGPGTSQMFMKQKTANSNSKSPHSTAVILSIRHNGSLKPVYLVGECALAQLDPSCAFSVLCVIFCSFPAASAWGQVSVSSAKTAQSAAAVATLAAAAPCPLADLAAASRGSKQNDAKPAGRRWFTQLSDDEESDEFGFSKDHSISESESAENVVQHYNEQQPYVQLQQYQSSRGGPQLLVQAGPSVLAWLPQVSSCIVSTSFILLVQLFVQLNTVLGCTNVLAAREALVVTAGLLGPVMQSLILTCQLQYY